MNMTKEEQERYLNMPIVDVVKELNGKGLNDDQILEIFTCLIAS